MDLDKIKLKTAEQLIDTEKEFLRANIDKLNEEDKEAYKDIIIPPEPETSTPEEPENLETHEPETSTPEDKKFTFSNEEEAREFVRKQTEENERAKQAAIDAAKTPAEKKYVDENWRPKNWDEAVKLAVKHAKEEIRKEDEENRQKQISQSLQKQWEDLAIEKKLPDIKTKEGRTIHDNIVKYGIATNKHTFQEAYDVWLKVPKEIGGGFNPDDKTTLPITPSDAGKILAQQKKVASKIGGQNSGVKPAGTAGKISYDKLHKARTTEELLKQEGYI